MLEAHGVIFILPYPLHQTVISAFPISMRELVPYAQSASSFAVSPCYPFRISRFLLMIGVFANGNTNIGKIDRDLDWVCMALFSLFSISLWLALAAMTLLRRLYARTRPSMC